jgi:hypothetical protein
VACETVEDAEAPIRDLVLPGLIDGVALRAGKNYDYLGPSHLRSVRLESGPGQRRKFMPEARHRRSKAESQSSGCSGISCIRRRDARILACQARCRKSASWSRTSRKLGRYRDPLGRSSACSDPMVGVLAACTLGVRNCRGKQPEFALHRSDTLRPAIIAPLCATGRVLLLPEFRGAPGALGCRPGSTPPARRQAGHGAVEALPLLSFWRWQTQSSWTQG